MSDDKVIAKIRTKKILDIVSENTERYSSEYNEKSVLRKYNIIYKYSQDILKAWGTET